MAVQEVDRSTNLVLVHSADGEGFACESAGRAVPLVTAWRVVRARVGVVGRAGTRPGLVCAHEIPSMIG